MYRRIAITGAAALAAAGLALSAAIPASAATVEYELVEVAPSSVYSVVGPLLETGGIVYFAGTSPSAPGSSWLFSFDPATGVVGPVGAAASLGGANGLTTGGGLVFFLSNASSDEQLYVYDPATDTVGGFDWPAGRNAIPDQLAVLGADVYVVMDDDLLYSVPISDPTVSPGVPPVATTPVPFCLDGTTAPTGLPLNVSSAGAFVYYDQYCADVAGSQLFRRSGPLAAEVIGFPPPPAASDLVLPYAVFDGGTRTFFAGGLVSGTQHMYAFDPTDLTQPLADLGGVNPGRQALFQGATTWFMGPDGARRIYASANGLTATDVGPTSSSDLEAEQGLVAWGDVLLISGFRVITPSSPPGTRANYFYDPVDGSITRVGPDGAIVPPFVTADGTAYVTAYAAHGADGDSQHLYRVVVRMLPDTGLAAWPGITIAAGLLALGGAFVAMARLRSHRPDAGATPRG
jgi:hypothetical protein